MPNKIYFSELILIICTNDIYSFKEWLYWHCNIIKFDHIVIINNNSTVDLKSECKKYNNVEYIEKSGNISQSEIYTYYVNNSKAYWCICLDDDEYLYINDKYNNSINDYICYFQKEYPEFLKISFSWIMMFSKILIINRDLKNSIINDFTYSLIDKYIITDGKIEIIAAAKALVNTLVKHYYSKDTEKVKQITRDDLNLSSEELYSYYIKNQCKNIIPHDKIGTVHNPISKLNGKYIHALNATDKKLTIGFVAHDLPSLSADAFIAHYKYRSVDEWNYKINNRSKFNDLYSAYDYHYQLDKINKIYACYQNQFIENNLIKNLWNKHEK